MTAENTIPPVKAHDRTEGLATMVHEHWLLGYGHREIGERLSQPSEAVGRALGETPGRSGSRNQIAYAVCQRPPSDPDRDLGVASSRAIESVERRWVREHPEVAGAVRKIVDAATLEPGRTERLVVLRVHYPDALGDSMAGLARMIESDVVARLREML